MEAESRFTDDPREENFEQHFVSNQQVTLRKASRLAEREL